MIEQGSGDVYALWSYLILVEQKAWEEVGRVVSDSTTTSFLKSMNWMFSSLYSK